MAKNKARRNRPQDQAKPKNAASAEVHDLKGQESAAAEADELQKNVAEKAAGAQKAAEKPADAARPAQENKSSKKKEALYRVVTKKARAS